MLRVLDIRRESRVALDAGDTRAAVIMTALSCEMLITVLVSSLLWEEDYWPQEAAPMIEASRELRSRLVSIAGSRLRGSWTDSHNQALSDWNRLVQRTGIELYTPEMLQQSNWRMMPTRRCSTLKA
jgi:hypothetical protein